MIIKKKIFTAWRFHENTPYQRFWPLCVWKFSQYLRKTRQRSLDKLNIWQKFVKVPWTFQILRYVMLYQMLRFDRAPMLRTICSYLERVFYFFFLWPLRTTCFKVLNEITYVLLIMHLSFFLRNKPFNTTKWCDYNSYCNLIAPKHI